MSIVSSIFRNRIFSKYSSPLKLSHRLLSTSPEVCNKKEKELYALVPLEVVMYKRDILERLSDDASPFSVKTMRHGLGSKEEPNLIPSAFESRMVGCVCEEDSTNIVWMWLKQGECKKCQCGFWFKLYYQEPPVLDKDTLTYT